jgi:hypothetical protein
VAQIILHVFPHKDGPVPQKLSPDPQADKSSEQEVYAEECLEEFIVVLPELFVFVKLRAVAVTTEDAGHRMTGGYHLLWGTTEGVL